MLEIILIEEPVFTVILEMVNCPLIAASTPAGLTRPLRSSLCRRFGTKCGGCFQGISPNDLVRRARSKVFHLNCFTCMMCNKQLSTGEELYIIDENKFVCKEDYLSNSNVKDTNLLSGVCARVRACACVSG